MPNRWVGSGKTVIRRQSGGTVAPVTLILDQFTDTDATALESHTIAPTNTPAASWASDSGAMDINGNKARGTVLAGGLISYVCNSGVSDGVVSADVTPVASGVTGLVLRRNSNVNDWTLIIDVDADLFRLYEHTTGFTLRASTAATIVVGNTYALSATLSGTSIVATVDGANQISFSSSTYQTDTRHGLRDDHTGGKFDNFKVVG